MARGEGLAFILTHPLGEIRLHAALSEEGAGDGGEDGDDELNDGFPGGLFHVGV